MLEKNHLKHQIADLYPGLPPTERDEIEITLRGYIAVVRRIFKKVSRRNGKLLTELARRARLRKSGKSA